MSRKVKWGVLSTAKIGLMKVIPAMQKGSNCEIVAIASSDIVKARSAASELGIPRSYGSYEELLSDPEVEAVYNPLPNHLHVLWSIRALQAGKHVLCEKPVGISSEEAQQLAAAARKYPSAKVMEAFMYRHHPQWQKARALVKEGRIGELRTIQSFFSYYNVDPGNIRNQPEAGGGGMMDIGCYCISLARFIFSKEPSRVVGTVEYDPVLGTDRLASAILDFGSGTSTFTCSTQLVPYQRVNIFGTSGRIEIEIPFNAPSDKPCKLWISTGDQTEEITFETCDQYLIQGELFSKAIIENSAVPTPLEDAVGNMKVIEAVVASSKAASWIKC